jgi:hypothetical protein
MKRFFFVFLFALTALFFTACSSSDDDDNGGGGSTLPYPDPKGVAGFPGSYQSTSIDRLYDVATGADAEFKAAWTGKGSAWTCDTSGCDATVDGVSYKAQFPSGSEIKLSVQTTTSSTNALPNKSHFNNFPPVTPVAGYALHEEFGYSIGFDTGDLRSTYQTAYTKALTDNGFTDSGYFYNKDLGNAVYASVRIDPLSATSAPYTLWISVQIQ